MRHCTASLAAAGAIFPRVRDDARRLQRVTGRSRAPAVRDTRRKPRAYTEIGPACIEWNRRAGRAVTSIKDSSVFYTSHSNVVRRYTGILYPQTARVRGARRIKW